MNSSSRNRGKLQIELKSCDVSILEKLKSKIKVFSSLTSRTRKTNFSQHIQTSILGVFNKEFKDYLVELGIPYGSKKNIIIPDWVRESPHFWRGIIDGDGSLGITAMNKPFVSLVTQSESMAQNFVCMIELITGHKKQAKRNKRDNVYNLVILNEKAQQIITFLQYLETNLAIERKSSSARKVLNWKRPDYIKKRDFEKKSWSIEEDKYILCHSIKDSIVNLHRTKKSIQSRIWRLTK